MNPAVTMISVGTKQLFARGTAARMDLARKNFILAQTASTDVNILGVLITGILYSGFNPEEMLNAFIEKGMTDVHPPMAVNDRPANWVEADEISARLARVLSDAELFATVGSTRGSQMKSRDMFIDRSSDKAQARIVFDKMTLYGVSANTIEAKSRASDKVTVLRLVAALPYVACAVYMSGLSAPPAVSGGLAYKFSFPHAMVMVNQIEYDAILQAWIACMKEFSKTVNGGKLKGIATADGRVPDVDDATFEATQTNLARVQVKSDWSTVMRQSFRQRANHMCVQFSWTIKDVRAPDGETFFDYPAKTVRSFQDRMFYYRADLTATEASEAFEIWVVGQDDAAYVDAAIVAPVVPPAAGIPPPQAPKKGMGQPPAPGPKKGLGGP